MSYGYATPDQMGLFKRAPERYKQKFQGTSWCWRIILVYEVRMIRGARSCQFFLRSAGSRIAVDLFSRTLSAKNPPLKLIRVHTFPPISPQAERYCHKAKRRGQQKLSTNQRSPDTGRRTIQTPVVLRIFDETSDLFVLGLEGG